MSDINNDTDSTHRPEFMLTTVDNPFDPFTQWDEWFTWDQGAGYHTAGFLARIAKVSDETSEADQHIAIQQAIDEIVRENVLGLYRKVKRKEINNISS